MTPTRVLIHGSLTRLPVLESREECLLSVIHRLDYDSGQVLHVDATLVRVFFYGQVLVVIFREEIQNLLIVDLQIRTTY